MTVRSLAAGFGLVLLLACEGAPKPEAPVPQPRQAAPQPRPAPEPASSPGTEAMATPLSCLATTLYHEGRGDGDDAMRAVGAVVMNRVRSASFPNDVCAVVKQGGETGSCQFSWWCDGRSDAPSEPDAFARAEEIAQAILNGAPDPTGGATYFHNVAQTPAWAGSFRRTATIGAHAYYAE